MPDAASCADTPYPLKFEPMYVEKPWGGRTITRLGRELPGGDDTKVGEAWELVDLPESGTTGGGSARSVIANGPLAGQTIHDAMDAFGPRLLGDVQLNPATSGFPLLIKFLDARENLSVQVHPSAEFAAANPGAHLKSEAWYIVEADEGAAIYKGIREGVAPDDFRAALEANDRQRVEDMLVRVPVKAGDCHYLPSGTCHALGGGILVAEVQTASDTTFRVFDWGRVGREMHIEQAMACITFGPADVAAYEQRSHVAGVHTTVSRLVQCEHFRIEKVRMSESYQQDIPFDQPVIWIVLEGRGVLSCAAAEATPFTRGDTLLLPAELEKGKVALAEDSVWLEVTFP